MRLELITPVSGKDKWPRGINPPQLTLPLLAALTPPDIDITFTEEGFEELTYKNDADLVGISLLTPFAPRGYEIADEYRKRGIKVVLGGIHATALPGEAIRHADAVVVGEAENVWGRLIDDFKANRLKRFYRSDEPPSLDQMPIPKRELSKHKSTFSPYGIQTTRGCPFSCTFCCVTKFFGGTFRSRPVKDVIREIETADKKNWVFIDDNVIGDQNYAARLFRELIPLKIRWIGQSSLLIARNDDLLRLAAKSGCFGLFIGFESLSSENLASLNKTFNKVAAYEQAVKKIYDAGIWIQASFVFGFDGDGKDVFERTVAFLKKNNFCIVSLPILTPFPGTDLYENMRREGRLLTRDWSKYDYGTAVFSPKRMTPEELEEGARWAHREFYSVSSIFSRYPQNWRHPLVYFLVNWSYRAKLGLTSWGRL